MSAKWAGRQRAWSDRRGWRRVIRFLRLLHVEADRRLDRREKEANVMPEHQLPASDPCHRDPPALKGLPDGAAGSAARSPESHAAINLASESVAGEDPGASLDTPSDVNS